MNSDDSTTRTDEAAPPPQAGAPAPPRELARRVVRSYPDYAGAERAVDFLADNDFPVERVTIVGRGLHMVEQVTGRMRGRDAALRGALTGAMVGFLVGWLFGLFDWTDPIVSAFWLAIDGLWFGAVAGLLVGLLFHALLRGRRDFASVSGVQAERYDVVVDDEVAGRAEELLAGLDSRAPASATERRPA
jgi:uncharacterized membrane protein